MNLAARCLLVAIIAIVSVTVTVSSFADSPPTTTRRLLYPGHNKQGTVSVPPPPCISFQMIHSASTATSNDGGDDFYADYDPSAYAGQYDNHNTNTGVTPSSSYNNNNNSRDRRSSSGSGGGESHGYTRDTSGDNSPLIDIDAVNKLLSERVRAKKNRDFVTADQIRDSLRLDHGVGVFDRERTWTTWTPARRGRGGDGGKKRDMGSFGPLGHDYDLVEDAGENTSTMTEVEIHSLLSKRLAAKMGRNFSLADRHQSTLLEAGVFVHDHNKQWRADGIAFPDLPTSQYHRPERMARTNPDQEYTKSPHSPSVEGMDDDRIIDALVKERHNCKLIRAYAKADAIREGLRAKYNIVLDDKIREWSVGGDFGAEHNAVRETAMAVHDRGYRKSAYSSPDRLLSGGDEGIVEKKVEERLEAKKRRDFVRADAIRDELVERFGVVLSDKLKQWSVGGGFGPDTPKIGGVYERRGGGDLTVEQVALVNKMIVKRYLAKKDRDYNKADKIRNHLRDTLNIQLDDRNNEWQVDSAEYLQVSELDTAEVSQCDIDIIIAKIAERHAHKVNRDYVSADSVRDELMETYGVQLDDSAKEWKCVLPIDGKR